MSGIPLQAASICVRALDYAELPLSGAFVIATDLHSDRRLTGLTDKNGVACLQAVPEGLYSVEVGRAGFLNVRYYPVRVAPEISPTLQFRLPFGEITEGLLVSEATLSGTLRRGTVVVSGAEICLSAVSTETQVSARCALTNDLGEYVIIVPPGAYTATIRVGREMRADQRIEMPSAGTFRNLIQPLP